ncbi:MAG: C10 family peptidase, partial [Muribaculaceae bacterium]|nr:C10 family peptidase [Muribaculaceae bacterium]
MVSVPPLLSSSVRKWGDGEPFNKYAPIVNNVTGKRAKLGCVAVSCAMMMSYYKWPNKYSYAGVDWDAINNEKCNDTLCKLLLMMGSEVELHTQYGEDYSYSNVDNIVQVFDQFYYSYESFGKNVYNFDVSSASAVKSQLPRLM